MAPKVKDALPLGFELGNFVLGAPLGQGGFGITYSAQHAVLGQHVAVKEYLPTEIASRDDDGRPDVVALDDDYIEIYEKHLQGFVDEAVTLAKFKHPNIVRVQDVFKQNGTAYMVMDFEDGESLERVFRQSANQPEDALLRWLHPLLNSLEVVHEAGFIHRDIKPDNIIVRHDGSPVLLDFGAARQAIGVKTRQLTVLMTRDYGPYEQFDFGTGKQGAWTDIYALGATLYRAITGKPPKNAFDRNRARATRKPDPLVKAVDCEVKGYSKQLLEAIDAALVFLPEERPQNIAAWRAMLPPPPDKTASGTPIQTASASAGSSRGGVKMAAVGAVGGLLVGGAIFGGLIAGGLVGGEGSMVEKLNTDLQIAIGERDAARTSAQRLQSQVQTAQSEAQQASAQANEQLTQAQASVAAQLAKATQLRGALDAKTAELAALDVKYNELLGKLSEATAAPPEPVVVTLTDEQKRQRDELVAKGEAAAKALRLSTPAGNNAVEFFRSALEIDPNSEGAWAGLDNVAVRYINLAKRNNCQKAKDYLPRAAALVPESPVLGAAATSFDGCGVGPSDFAFRDSLTDGGNGPDLVTVPAGEFSMGGTTSEADVDEKPVHRVTLAKPFAMGLTEVTFDDYDKFAEATGREKPNDGKQGRGALPVINVSYDDATAYTAWLTQQTGAIYRLPTEAEWEYAARAQATGARYWGDASGCEYANAADQTLKANMKFNSPIYECEDGHARAAPAAQYKPNGFGLYDMLGNVWEWTSDCWVESYENAPTDGSAKTRSGCSQGAVRGGSWAGTPKAVRAANRFKFDRDKEHALVGFRIVREVRK